MMETWEEESLKISYGKFNCFDSLAPEFETYDTIRELAQNKKGNKTDKTLIVVRF